VGMDRGRFFLVLRRRAGRCIYQEAAVAGKVQV